MSPSKKPSSIGNIDTGTTTPASRSGGANTLTSMFGVGALALAAMNSPELRAENWQDQGVTNYANADGEYQWCFGGDPNGVHVRQVYDSVGGEYVNQLHDGTSTGTHLEGIDAAIEAYDSSISAQDICVEDVDPNLDQIKFQDIGRGVSFVVNGYVNTGSISSLTDLDGNVFYTGNLYNGRTFGTTYVGSDPVGAYEQFEGASPTEYYLHPSDDLVTVIVNPDTDQVFGAKDFVTGQVYKYDNASLNSGSDSTESTLTGIAGEPRSWKDAADSSTGMNSFSTIYDGVVHTIVDMDSGATVDPDTDGDGDLDSVDCDDTDATINSTATEMCDGADNNCDGSTDGVDSADVATWYRDADGDGAGDATSTQEACDEPAGYVDNDTDFDDTDPTVTLEPVETEDECDGEESAGGEFESGEPICGPDGMAVVWSGAVDYDDSLAITYMADAQDWLEFQDSLPMDSSTYNGLIVTPPVGSHGGYALAITDADMTAFLGAPPPSLGVQPATLRVDEGEEVLVENLIQGTSEYFGEGTHDLLEEGVVDADGDGVFDNVYNDPDEFPSDASESADADSDGEGDNADSDDDNDGYSDSEEAAAGTNPNDDSSHPSEPDDTAGDTDDTDDTAQPDTDEPDTDEPGTEDSAGEGETPKDKQGSSCSAMTDLSLTSSSMPWVLAAAGLTVVGRRRRSSSQAA